MLADAASAVAAGDLAAALATALAVWRDTPDPELARVIEELGAALPMSAPLPAGSGAAQAAAFEARARRDDPSDLAVLLAAPLPRAVAPFAARLRVLAARAPDPRFATYLHRLLAAPPFGQREFWALMFELVIGVGDPRSIARLEDLGGGLEHVVRAALLETVERKRVATQTALRIQRARPLPRPHELVLLEAALADHAHAARTARQGGAVLLAEILAHPDDDRPRQVYADWLIERGDPRGELIALQLAPPSAASVRRERALLAAHGAAWLGALAPVAVRARCRFTRGFPTAIVLNPRTAAQLAPLVGAPEWATVEELTFSGAATYAERACADIAGHPIASALRAVHGVGDAPAELLARSPRPLPIETLGLATFGQLPPSLGVARGLPALAHVVLARPEWMIGLADVRTLAQTPLGGRLRSLGTRSGEFTITLERSARGALDRLRVDPGSFREPALLAARAEVDAYAAAFRVREVVLVTRDALPADADGLRDRLLGPLAPLTLTPA